MIDANDTTSSDLLPGVLPSARYIAKHAIHVKPSEEGIQETARLLAFEGDFTLSDKEEVCIFEPPNLSNKEVVEWIFLLDTLNFCFWADTDQKLPRVKYRGSEWTGYRSLCAALARAVEAGIPIHNPKYYGSLSLTELRHILCSDNGLEIPMLQERLDNLHEAASVLEEEFGGDVCELVAQCDGCAQKLIKLLAARFSSYRDVSFYKEQRVSFLKRAQIFVGDLWSRFGGRGFGRFDDIHTLTMFADYRVPQALHHLGAMQYDEQLTNKLKSGVHLLPGCPEEVEIRGVCVWTVELIRRELMEVLAAKHTCSQLDDSTQKEMDCARVSLTRTECCKQNDSSVQQDGRILPASVSCGSNLTQLSQSSVGECSTQAQASHNRSFTETPSADNSRSSLVPEVFAIQIDYFLWNYAKSNAAQMAGDPIHRTKTIFY